MTVCIRQWNLKRRSNVPSPSCPQLLSPHAQASPLSAKKTLCPLLLAASQARAKVRLARKYDHLKTKKWLYPDQLELVSKLHDGTLEEEAARLTKASGASSELLQTTPATFFSSQRKEGGAPRGGRSSPQLLPCAAGIPIRFFSRVLLTLEEKLSCA